MDLLKTYGYCIIPAGTILFSSKEKNIENEYQFFGLKYFVSRAFKFDGINKRNVFAYKVSSDIEVLFMIKEMTYRYHSISSIDKIYKVLNPDSPDYDDLDIKQNKERLQKTTDYIKIQSFYGFLTSLENKLELEICLFEGALKMIERLNFTENQVGVKFEYYDALKELELFPSERFINRSKMKFKNNRNEFLARKKDEINYLINEDGYTLQRANFETYNMRFKLNI